MPHIEDVDELTEWLADEAWVWGVFQGDATLGHPETCRCRPCWTLDVKQRIRAAVQREKQP